MDDFNEADKAWIIRMLREREEAIKTVASIESTHEDYARSRRQIVGLQKQVDELRAMVSNREAEISALKKEIQNLKKGS